ncbi:hypothetical protein A4X09_0g1874 [Tilletia walkeri]|uniref:Uncharacterized protein n=1 Tax=Tilletia walkeri TaxID=117179 RepID=A0A8X7NDH6_9BASI|nr:hypothetical protein A4X09_0g1874 [Tilletia walkeri]
MGSRRNKNQGVNMDGKVRETTVTTQPLRQGKGSATTRRTEAGKGREDKTRNTSEPAYGRDRRQATASAGSEPRPATFETIWRAGAHRQVPQDHGKRRSPQPTPQDENSGWLGGRRSTKEADGPSRFRRSD